MAVTAQEVILWPVAGLRGGRPPRTASTPDCTGTHARVRHAFPSCGTDGAWRLRRSSPSRSALSTAHRGSLAGTSWAWALPGRGSWLVSSWGDAECTRALMVRGCARGEWVSLNPAANPSVGASSLRPFGARRMSEDMDGGVDKKTVSRAVGGVFGRVTNRRKDCIGARLENIDVDRSPG